MRVALALLALVLFAPAAAAASLSWEGDTPLVLVEGPSPRTYRVEGPEGARFRFGDGPNGTFPAEVALPPGAHPITVHSPRAGWLLLVPRNVSEGGIALPVEAAPREPAATPQAPPPEEPPEAQAEAEAPRSARWIPGPGVVGALAAFALALRRSS